MLGDLAEAVKDAYSSVYEPSKEVVDFKKLNVELSKSIINFTHTKAFQALTKIQQDSIKSFVFYSNYSGPKLNLCYTIDDFYRYVDDYDLTGILPKDIDNREEETIREILRVKKEREEILKEIDKIRKTAEEHIQEIKWSFRVDKNVGFREFDGFTLMKIVWEYNKCKQRGYYSVRLSNALYEDTRDTIYIEKVEKFIKSRKCEVLLKWHKLYNYTKGNTGTKEELEEIKSMYKEIS